VKVGVLDASTAIRLYVPDGPLTDGIEEFLELAWQANVRLLAPELLLIEFLAVLDKKEKNHFITSSDSDEIYHEFIKLPISYISHTEIIEEARNYARKLMLTIYDSLYLAICDKYKARLFTNDKVLEEAALKSCVAP
jgi:predicted nucleic acid-binding protein